MIQVLHMWPIYKENKMLASRCDPFTMTLIQSSWNEHMLVCTSSIIVMPWMQSGGCIMFLCIWNHCGNRMASSSPTRDWERCMNTSGGAIPGRCHIRMTISQTTCSSLSSLSLFPLIPWQPTIGLHHNSMSLWHMSSFYYRLTRLSLLETTGFSIGGNWRSVESKICSMCQVKRITWSSRSGFAIVSSWILYEP